uniref:uncharacterized protein LOC124073223 isoform X2 n=1 Tax=Scatophagus argus TaxID=75038 RepID=UPI001ED800C0|nr:uncharacterized protein LOC124073223 isoform X2 [Scatophagus argus]
MENHDDNTDAERESEVKSVISSVTNEQVGMMEESEAETKCDPANEAGDGGESENKSETSTTKEKGELHTSGNKDQQSVKISQEINRKDEYQREFKTLLDRLHLQDKHQKKLTPGDFLQIGPPVKQDHDTSGWSLSSSIRLPFCTPVPYPDQSTPLLSAAN